MDSRGQPAKLLCQFKETKDGVIISGLSSQVYECIEEEANQLEKLILFE
jgi:hypothetical protein